MAAHQHEEIHNMIDDAMKRDIKRHLCAVGIDAAVVDELCLERKTLRDEFAMAALPGVMDMFVEGRRYVPEKLAMEAYVIADAMLAWRSK
jgi:hypothetical protein